MQGGKCHYLHVCSEAEGLRGATERRQLSSGLPQTRKVPMGLLGLERSPPAF